MDAKAPQISVDPITLEVIRHGLVSITNQIDANITRTAFSPYIYEYKDYAVGLTGPDGELVAQCTGGMPLFVADSVGMAVRDGLQIYGSERLHHGDVVLCNHAAVQGQHLNNTVMYTPIFAGPRRDGLIGFFAINVHWIDIGGVGAALDRHLHGRPAAAHHQTVVEGRTDRGDLPHHREQHAPPASSWATSRRSSPAACSDAT